MLLNTYRWDASFSAEILLLGDEDQGLCGEVCQNVQHREQNQGHGRTTEKNVWNPNAVCQKTSQVRLVLRIFVVQLEILVVSVFGRCVYRYMCLFTCCCMSLMFVVWVWYLLFTRVMIAAVNTYGNNPTLQFFNNFMDQGTDDTSRWLREGEYGQMCSFFIHAFAHFTGRSMDFCDDGWISATSAWTSVCLFILIIQSASVFYSSHIVSTNTS